MRKILRTYAIGIVASFVFATVVGVWTAPRLAAAIHGPRPFGELRAIVPAALPSPIATDPAPATTITTAAPATAFTSVTPSAAATSSTPSTPSTPPAAFTPSTTPVPSSAYTPSVPTTSSVPSLTPAPTLSAAVQIAMQQALEQQGKLFLEAIQRGDDAAVQSMLAARCQSADIAALVAARQGAISAQAGVAIADITPLTTFVGHFDAGAGEAHTVLEWIANGQRMTLLSADGWLYEDNQWKNTTC